MEKVTPAKVTLLASGINIVAKQMQGNAGDLLPKHLANLESILFVHEGEIILHFPNEEKVMKSGTATVIPAQAVHQIKVLSDFKGIHFMPKNIRFQFFDK